MPAVSKTVFLAFAVCGVVLAVEPDAILGSADCHKPSGTSGPTLLQVGSGKTKWSKPFVDVDGYAFYANHSISYVEAKEFYNVSNPLACSVMCQKMDGCVAFMIGHETDLDGNHNCSLTDTFVGHTDSFGNTYGGLYGNLAEDTGVLHDATTTTTTTFAAAGFFLLANADTSECVFEVGSFFQLLPCDQADDDDAAIWERHPSGHLTNKASGRCIGFQKVAMSGQREFKNAQKEATANGANATEAEDAASAAYYAARLHNRLVSLETDVEEACARVTAHSGSFVRNDHMIIPDCDISYKKYGPGNEMQCDIRVLQFETDGPRWLVPFDGVRLQVTLRPATVSLLQENSAQRPAACPSRAQVEATPVENRHACWDYSNDEDPSKKNWWSWCRITPCGGSIPCHVNGLDTVADGCLVSHDIVKAQKPVQT